MERAVHFQLCSHLSEHKILSPYQFGFRKAHSTEFATISLTDTIRRNIDQGLLTGAVFIELRKAFDTVDHAVLLKKLHSLGITKQELNWFEDYLSDRLQVVGYQNVLSEPELVTSGVPQGSIIGPLLFVLLVNDLPKVTSSCILLMYADDSVLFYSHIDFSGKTECLLSGTRAKLSAVNSFNITNKGRAITRVL